MNSLQNAINIIIALLLGILVHELAHALVATWQGDDTPRRAGHLSLNPFRHMDQFGIVMLFLTALTGMGFTYGFTPVNPRMLRYGPRYGHALVAIAGPIANILTAIVFAVPVVLAQYGTLTLSPNLFNALVTIYSINVFLGIFNLLPIPPLDGWTVFSMFLSPRMVFDLRQFVQYGPMVLLLLFMLNPYLHIFSYISDYLISPVANGILNGVAHLTGVA